MGSGLSPACWALALFAVCTGCESSGERPSPGMAVSGDDDGGGSSSTVVPIVPFDGGPTDIPLTLSALNVSLGDGGTVFDGYRLALQFQLGTAPPVDAFLDTGSEGIQVNETALTTEQMASIHLTGATIQATFSGGVVATGVVGTASVTFGDRTTPVPIPIIVYQAFACAENSACALAALTADVMAQDIFSGFSAIVGAGLRNQSLGSWAVGSPIPQLPGQPSFIVEAPSYGSSATGTLHIGPAADEVSQYATFQLPPYGAGSPLSNGTPAWDDTAVAACINDQTTSMDYCGNAVLDTGSPATVIYLTTQTVTSSLPPGYEVGVTVGPTSSPIAQFQVMITSSPQPGQDSFIFTQPAAGLGDSINLGLTVFFHYKVYLNPVSGQIGLLPL